MIFIGFLIIGQLTMHRNQLFEIIYKFIFDLNLKNVADFVGNTGPHLFLNEISKQIKVVDYGLFKVSTNPPFDFLMMVKEIQDVVIDWPSEEVMECYRKIMNLDEEITDETCRGLLLYQGRLFLERKLNPKKSKRPKKRSTKLGPVKQIKKRAGKSIRKTKKKKKKKQKKQKKTKRK